MIASCSLLAGYVEVEDQAFISGGVAVHQFCEDRAAGDDRGHTGVSSDVPPFITCAGYRGDATGLNLVGLKRAGFDAARIAAMKRAYGHSVPLRTATGRGAGAIEAEIDAPEARHIGGIHPALASAASAGAARRRG